MSALLPLPVAVPLLAAALLVAGDRLLPRWAHDAVAIAAAAVAAVASLAVLAGSQHHDVVHWFGGWKPHGGVAFGIDFAADPLGAGMACVATVLVLLVLVYSIAYMHDQTRTFHVLVLTFGGAMAGFSLTGDVFNMFVWFELMGVSAYALAGFSVEELGPLQGAVNFAITNTVGAYLILTGIALLYARSGALNLTQIGHVLGHGRADGLVIVAFLLIVVGLMVKAAIVPFHFWLADAHAASPAPVCALLSGAMVELGIVFIARVYWTVFAVPLGPHAGEVTKVLVALGVLTALVGAVMCFLQRHIKRMLAYSTISHAGLMLTGVALLDPRSLGGVAALILSHAFLKGGLFLIAGVVLVTLRRIDELRLHGAGRSQPALAVLWFAASLGLIGVPYAGAALGHQLLDEGARTHGYAWLAAVAVVASGVCGGAMLRAGARVFMGWGARSDSMLTPEPDEARPERAVPVWLMTVVSGIAVLLGLLVTLAPGLEMRIQTGAQRFVAHAAYESRVLHAATPPVPASSAHSLPALDGEAVAYGLGALLLALLVAAFGLWHEGLPVRVRDAGTTLLGTPVAILRGAHSGIVGDYLLWLCAGTVALGAVFAWLL